MRDAEFDLSDLDDLTIDLLDVANRKLPVESKRFIRNEQGKLKTRVKRKTKSKTNRKTGKLYDSVDRSKTYQVDGITTGKVYNKARHAHLIEEPHRIVGHLPEKKDTGKKSRAFKIMEESQKEFKPKFESDVEQWVDQMLDEKGL